MSRSFVTRGGSREASWRMQPNSILGFNGWRERNTRILDIEIADSQSMRVFELLAARNGTVRRFWYWYEVDGMVVGE